MFSFFKKYKSQSYIVLILVVSAVLIILTNQYFFKDFAWVSDEYAYTLAARTFASGQLYVESPEPVGTNYFNSLHVVNRKGRYFGKYSPGWPFFLMFGYMIGLPMVVNLIFGVLSVYLVYLIARRMFSENVGLLAAFLMAINPYFLFSAGSYFLHVSTMFFCILFVYIYLRNLEKESKINWILMGVALGIAFNIRPYDPFFVGFVFAIHYFYICYKKKIPVKDIIVNGLLFTGGFGVFFAIFLWYNYAQTGNPLMLPTWVHNKNDYPHPRLSVARIRKGIINNLIPRSIKLNYYVPLFYVFMVAAFIPDKKKSKKSEYVKLMAFTFVAMVLGYFFYSTRKFVYGPRYWFAAAFAVYVIYAVGIDNMKKISINVYRWTVILITIASLALLIYLGLISRVQNTERMFMYDRVEATGIDNAIVLVEATHSKRASGSMPVFNLIRNDINYENPVLYARFNKDHFEELRGAYPERDFYKWKCKNIINRRVNIFDFYLNENIDCRLKLFDSAKDTRY